MPGGTTGDGSTAGRQPGLDTVEIEATVTEFNEGDGIGGEADLLGDFGLSEVRVLHGGDGSGG